MSVTELRKLKNSEIKALSEVLAKSDYCFDIIKIKDIKINDIVYSFNEKIKNYHGNLLLIHGTNDTNLPYSMSEKILKNCPSNSKKLITVKDGDHYAAFKKENWNKLITEVK